MKKLVIMPFLLALLFVSCEKEASSLDEQDIISSYNKGLKVDLCHYDADNDSWVTISVNENALQAHLNHGDVQLVDNDGDGWVDAENECVPGGDCNDDDPAVNPGVSEICGDGIDNNCDGQVDEECLACIEYEWSVFLNSIDLTNACRDAFGIGVILYSFGLNGDYTRGLYVETNGFWISGQDNNNQSGNQPPESFDCFIDYLEANNVPYCNGARSPSPSENSAPFLNINLDTK